MKIYAEWDGGNVNYFVYDVVLYDELADDDCDGATVAGGAMEAPTAVLVTLLSRPRHHHLSYHYRCQGHGGGHHDGRDGDGHRDHLHHHQHGDDHDNR